MVLNMKYLGFYCERSMIDYNSVTGNGLVLSTSLFLGMISHLVFSFPFSGLLHVLRYNKTDIIIKTDFHSLFSRVK